MVKKKEVLFSLDSLWQYDCESIVLEGILKRMKKDEKTLENLPTPKKYGNFYRRHALLREVDKGGITKYRIRDRYDRVTVEYFISIDKGKVAHE